jgi:Carboxypeptidase regulatory-like domain/TonB dependent receptor-like, beta-barrel
MNRLFARLVLLALAGTLAFAAFSTAQITRGAISGTVRDATGALVPGAAVTVTNMDTNISRSVVTDDLGFYRVPALDPGRYAVKVELSGFQTVEFKDIRLLTATEVTLNPELKVAGVGEAITVVGEAAGVELNKTSPTVGITTLARQVVELPLSADRNVNNLIATAPNVSRVTGQGTFAVNGQRSRNNNYMIDGSDNNDISVTISTTQIVPESVAEFQVQTNAYSVEFGRNSGAQVNVITKSGTNRFHGEVWDYYRTADLYSLTNVQKAQGITEQPGFTRHQAGASLGGPIIKDRTFFFALYQYDGQRPEPQPGALTLMPTPEGYAALQNVPLRAGQPASSRQAVLDRLRFLQDVYAQDPVFSSLSSTTVNGVPIQLGRAGVIIEQPSTYHTFMGRIDHRLTDSDNLTLRYYLNKRKDTDQISNCAFGPIFCGSQDLKDQNLALSETHVFGPSVVNEFRFSLVKRDLLFPENDPTSPTATISGLFTVGGANNFPQSRVTDSYQFSDVATWTKGKHTLKFGADIRYNIVNNESAFDSKGTFTFNSLQDFMNNSAFQLNQQLVSASWESKQWQTYFFAQDDFRVTPDLTLNLGLRYELSGVPFGMFGRSEPEIQAALIPGPAQKDTNNWAPRVGFNWSPRSSNPILGDGKTVFRGGFGMGYDVIFYNLLTVNTNPNTYTASLFNVVDTYPNLLQASGSATFNPLGSYTNSPEDLQNPDSKFWSFSIGREIGEFVVELGYTGSKTGHGINQILANPAILTAEQAALVASTKNANAIPGTQARRLYPEFGNRTVIPGYVGPGDNDVEARSEYHGFYAQVQKRLSHGLQFQASYTRSRFESNNDASLGETGTDGSSQRPQSMFDYEAEWSLSQFDVPNRFVVSYLYEIPGPKSGILKHVLGGWQVSGITAFQSGRPFTIVTGVDSNGDGNTGSDRPNRVGGSLTWDDDHRTFTNNGYVATPLGTNNLPLANSQGDGSLGRNTERTASFWNTDVSLLKRLYMFGDRQLILRADAFNAFNQDSYGLPTVSMSSASFGKNSNNWGQRTITLSAKFVW